MRVARLRAAVIGLGVGEKHAEGYRAHPACDVAALCDISQEKRAAARKRFPEARVVEDASEILSDPQIDIVSIASYDDCHFEQTMEAIEGDKHVFVEKPLALFRDQAEEIRARLRAKPALRLSSNVILRTSPRFRDLKARIERGELGDLFHIEAGYDYGRLHKITDGWRGRLDFYSVVHGGGVHMVDLLMWLTGERITEVTAYGNSIASAGSGFGNFDMVVSILKFESGATGKVSANFGCVRPHFHALTAYGTKATFVNTPAYGELFTSRDPAESPHKLETPYPGAEKGDLIHSFVESILGDTAPEVTADEVFETMSVCFAIEQAVQGGVPVRVEYI